MLRRDFVKISSAAGAGFLGANTLNSCVGTYNPKIINAVWDEKFVFDSKNEIERLKQLVRCGVMAPSGHNTQPWHFMISDGRIELLPDFSRSLPVADRYNRELFISLGCCLENIIISAPLFGYTAEYEIKNGDSPSIVIYLSSGETASDKSLFDSMHLRQTTRNKYQEGKLPGDFLSSINTDKETNLIFSEDKESYNLLLDYIKEGNRLLFGNEDFLAELKEWIRFSDSEAEEKLDGLYSRALGNPSTARWFGKMAFNLSVTPKTQNKEDEEYIRSSSGLLFLLGQDSVEDWIETGRKLEQTLINITGMNLKYAFHNQPCQAEALRKDFAKDFGYRDSMPQAVIRIGYSDFMPRSPRRKIQDVIIQ